MSYKREHYKAVFDAVLNEFSMDSKTLTPDEWMGWTVQVKKLFDDGFSITEIINAVPQAGEKRKWQNGIRFWKRVNDILLLNRRERQEVKIDKVESIGDILKRR